MLEFWFEFGSTYSYPAAERVASIARFGAARIRYRPFLLGPIFKAQGWNTSPFNIYESKGRYMWRDLARRCDQLGLPFTRPDVFPSNGLLAARLCTALSGHDALPDLVRAIYRANFADGLDIAAPAALAAQLRTHGLDAAATITGQCKRFGKRRA